MGGHGGDQLLVAQARVGQIELLVIVLAGTQQLPGADAQLAEQVAHTVGVGRGFQVQDDVRRQAAGLKQFQRAAGLAAARVVIQRQIGHLHVASCVGWRILTSDGTVRHIEWSIVVAWV